MDDTLLDEYENNPGLSGLRRYASNNNVRQTSLAIRKYILRQIYENTPKGTNSSDYKEAQRLLKIGGDSIK